MNNKLKEKMQSLNNAGVPFMDGREKGDRLPLGSTVHLDGIGYIKGEEGEFAVMSFKELPELFFFGGKVITSKLKELESALTKTELADALDEGIEVLLEEKTNKSGKRNYVTIEFYPEC